MYRKGIIKIIYIIIYIIFIRGATAPSMAGFKDDVIASSVISFCGVVLGDVNQNE